MSNLFPATDRVIYRRNPLVEVICQLRFPPILTIDAELPAAFQERLRGEYPELQQSAQVPEVQGLPQAVAAALQSTPGVRARMAFDFLTADGAWKVTLTRDFVALTTTKYERWEDFRRRLVDVVAALTEIYRPSYVTRVGLRYRDAIQRSALGLADSDWADLLRPEIASILCTNDTELDITEAYARFGVALPWFEGRLAVMHGLGTNEQTDEVAYIVDADFATTRRTPPTEVMGILDVFNVEAGRFFRWCISEALHHAMDPEDADG